MERLKNILRRIDGRGYPAYKDIRGRYEFENFDLEILHVQGDPFAAPSRIAVHIPNSTLDLREIHENKTSRRVGVEDALLRSFSAAIRQGSRKRGSGKSGLWGILNTGQEILARTACEISPREITFRFTVGLPAQGRKILGRQAWELLGENLPEIVKKGVFSLSESRMREHADANEDQETLREIVTQEGWVAFIADGAILPRRSGIDDRPLDSNPIAWSSPEELKVEVTLPNVGKVHGSAIQGGVTLICGGGYHGKSTLLNALTRGVFNHIPGDGREQVVARDDTVYVRAEDGRRVESVDIESFISDLPDGRSTRNFSTENASGSTSQAANIIEALELGAGCLLIDEDTSATNFMVRDRRMQELVATECEPITPFVDRVQEIRNTMGVSTVLVVGGAGDYFDVADTVLILNAYRPKIATSEAREIAERFPANRQVETRRPFESPAPRVPLNHGFDASRGRRQERVRAQDTRAIEFGSESIDLSQLAQFVDPGQTRTVADWLLRCARGEVDGQTELRAICEKMEKQSIREGLSATTERSFGDRVQARRFEFGAAINRLRSLSISRNSD